jgi:hypothetical protein
MDFAKLVEVFDRHNVTFVSVTQSFNTTTSMGRLTLRGSKLYRYYVSTDAIRGRQMDTSESLRLPVDMVETTVVRELRRLLRAPEIVARAVTEVRRDMPSATERDVVTAIDQFHEVWAALFPAEQARIVRLLVERVTVTPEASPLICGRTELEWSCTGCLCPRPRRRPNDRCVRHDPRRYPSENEAPQRATVHPAA